MTGTFGILTNVGQNREKSSKIESFKIDVETLWRHFGVSGDTQKCFQAFKTALRTFFKNPEHLEKMTLLWSLTTLVDLLMCPRRGSAPSSGIKESGAKHSPQGPKVKKVDPPPVDVPEIPLESEHF